jgi:hypothetical protein
MNFRFLVQHILPTLTLLLLPTFCLRAEVEVPGHFDDRHAERDPASWYPARKEYTCKDYVDFVRERANWVRNGQDHGWYGPWRSIPALAVYAYESDEGEGDKQLAVGMMKTMRFYWQDIKRKVDKNGYIMNFDGGALCELIFSELDKRGDLSEDDMVLRKQMLLLHRKYTRPPVPTTPWQPATTRTSPGRKIGKSTPTKPGMTGGNTAT